MRIVAVADTHLFHDDLVVPDGDVFVHAGDLCRGGELHELVTAVEWIAALPHPTKIVVAGNHDWAFVREAAYARDLLGDIHYLQDAELVVDGVRFWGSPWQPAFNDWAFNLRRGEPLAAIWRKIPHGIDVLVTHSPPAGIGDRSPMGDRHGCEDLRKRLAELTPRLHLFGHIHQDGGVWEDDGIMFANVTTWECQRQPTVIDLDEDGVTAVVVPPSGRGSGRW